MFRNFNNRRDRCSGMGGQPFPPSVVPVNAPAYYGPSPYIADLDRAAANNNCYCSDFWSGECSQVNLMSLGRGEDIGLDMHPDADQILIIEKGRGLAVMGYAPDNLYVRQNVYEGTAVCVPAGTWCNIVNTGINCLKLCAIYAYPDYIKCPSAQPFRDNRSCGGAVRF